jgi:hypothetical protein
MTPRLRIKVIDLVTKGPTRALYSRLMNANLASIMAQVIAVWCEEAGHEVRFLCYTGAEDLAAELEVPRTSSSSAPSRKRRFSRTRSALWLGGTGR